jgi:hypothetical protein
VVLLHAETLLASSPEGATGYIQADLRHPELVLPQAAEVLDFGKPVAVMLLAVLHFVSDADDPAPRQVPVRAQPGLRRHVARQRAGDPPVRRARPGRARRGADLAVAAGLRPDRADARRAVGGLAKKS